MDESAVVTDAVNFDHDNVLKAVRHSEAILEQLSMTVGNPPNSSIIKVVRDLENQCTDLLRDMQQKLQQINVQADQLSEAEQKLLADEQVFARIREVIGADGAAPGVV